MLWLLHWLPLALLAPVGRAIGLALYALVAARRHVVLRNLELCLPEISLAQRRTLARQHFEWLGRSIVERGLLWYASTRALG
jgi:KDO2-lipid IV(A) lauroyltransferase